MIRKILQPITPEDELAIVEIASSFASEVNIAFDVDWATAQVKVVLNKGLGAGWMMLSNDKPVGALVAILVPSIYDGLTEAAELFWFVKKEYRNGFEPIKLLTHFEQWANEVGADRIKMAHLENSMPDRIGFVYKRLGYRPLEHVYVKDLK